MDDSVSNNNRRAEKPLSTEHQLSAERLSQSAASFGMTWGLKGLHREADVGAALAAVTGLPMLEIVYNEAQKQNAVRVLTENNGQRFAKLADEEGVITFGSIYKATDKNARLKEEGITYLDGAAKDLASQLGPFRGRKLFRDLANGDSQISMRDLEYVASKSGLDFKELRFGSKPGIAAAIGASVGAVAERLHSEQTGIAHVVGAAAGVAAGAAVGAAIGKMIPRKN